MSKAEEMSSPTSTVSFLSIVAEKTRLNTSRVPFR